jgi:hypothetical protein
MQTRNFDNAPVFQALQTLAVKVQTASPIHILAHLKSMLDSELFASVNWQRDLRKLALVIESGVPEFSVFAKNGNVKLPFVSFSSLPGVTCPGAGECLQFCYSYRAWRYPAAFCKQAQNAWLMRYNKPAIVRAWAELFNVKKLSVGFDFRLYVDGDFSSVADLVFWQDLLKSAPNVRAYGYSKSFALFLAYAESGKSFASNYMVNLSSGHNADNDTESKFAALPVVRGAFKAVSVGYNVTSSMHGTKEHNASLRNAYGQKAFTCPGKCGECTPSGHACGSRKFQNVDIIIAVH